jgi:hypothetical protein
MMKSFDSSNPQQQQQWRYPLYAVQKGNNAVLLRSLSEDDLQNLQLHNKLYFDARDRFRLFEIMKRNYGEWERFIKTLEDQKLRVSGDAMTDVAMPFISGICTRDPEKIALNGWNPTF